MAQAESSAPITVAVDVRTDPSLEGLVAVTNDVHGIVERHRAETLVRLDCRGRVIPGLAVSWRPDSGTARWFLRLRPGARFADGMPVTPEAVAAALARHSAEEYLEPWTGLRSTRTFGDTGLVVTFDRPLDDLRILSSPALAILSSSGEGSGPFVNDSADDRGLTMIRGQGAPLRVTWIDSDPRDAIDRATDLLVTRDPRAIAYGESRAGYRVEPLPWESVYLVLIPPAPTPAPEAGAHEAMARRFDGALRVDARPAMGPYWWRVAGTCPGVSGVVRPSGLTPEPAIVYRSHDSAAKDVAERLVALRGIDRGWTEILRRRTPDPLRVVGVEADAFASRVRGGRDAAYVVALPMGEVAPCRGLRALRRLAPWLPLSGDHTSGAIPLVETRAHAIVSDRLAGRVTVDWRGGVRLRQARP